MVENLNSQFPPNLNIVEGKINNLFGLKHYIDNTQQDDRYYLDSQQNQDQSIKIIQKKVKSNGFTWPFHAQQVLTWFIFGLNTYTFYFISLVSLSYNQANVLPLGIIYGIIVILVVIYAIKATKIDPTDPTIYKERNAKQKGEVFDNTNYQYFCEVCETHVQNSSKHCGQCNRCVNGFDHHCKWLNNCIGEANYRDFFKLICLVLVSVLIHTGTIATVLYFIYRDSDKIIKQNTQVYNKPMIKESKVLLIIACVFNSLTILFLTHLVSFHLYLQRQNLSTFEYIQVKNNRTNHKSKIFKEVDHEDDQQQKIDEKNEIEIESYKKDENEDYVYKDGILVEKEKDDQKIQDRNKNKSSCLGIFRKKQRKDKVENKQQEQEVQHQKQSIETQMQQVTDRPNSKSNSQQNSPKLSNTELQNIISKNRSSVNTSLSDFKVNEQSSITQKESSFSNDIHMMNIVKLGTGGDDQQHVQHPRQKQFNKGNIKRTQYQRQKQDLETIIEKAKEEEVAISISNMNIPKIELDESYSFSLRNYQNRMSSARRQSIKDYQRNHQNSQSQNYPLTQQDMYYTTEQKQFNQSNPKEIQRKNHSELNNNNSNIKNAHISSVSSLYQNNDKSTHKKPVFDYVQEEQSNKNIEAIKDNYIYQNYYSPKDKQQQTKVININKFSSYANYVQSDGEQMSAHRGDEPLKNQLEKESMDVSMHDLEEQESKRNASTSLPKIFDRRSSNTLKKDNSNVSIGQHPWLGVDLQKSSKRNLEQVSESINSDDEEDPYQQKQYKHNRA